MAHFRRVLPTILWLISSTINLQHHNYRIFGGQNIRGSAIFIVSALLQVKVGKVAILWGIYSWSSVQPQKLPV